MKLRLPSLIKPSTAAFTREARRTPGFSLYDWLHGYVYARWPYTYIGIGTREHPWVKRYGPPLKKLVGLLKPRAIPVDESELTKLDKKINDQEQYTFADSYHGKVVPIDAARQLVTVNEDLHLPDLEQVIPYRRARDLILQNPDHIVALECPCRSSRPDPCLPLDVCLIIGEPFASLIAEHHPQRARWIRQAEAVEILQAEEQRGHVHHAFFKDAMLERFYAICNCCSCCCGAMHSHQNGTPMLCSSGYVASVDHTHCIACGTCAEHCQFSAISLQDEYANVDWDECMGCGICVTHCPQEAITLHRDPEKGIPLEIRELTNSIASTEPQPASN